MENGYNALSFNFTVTTFCASPLWDVNITWYPRNGQPPDFTPCFHKTVLVYIPVAFLLLLSPLEFMRNTSNKLNRIAWAWLNVLKLVITLLLCTSVVLQEANLALMAYNDVAPAVGADFVGPAVKLAAYIL